MSSESYFKSSGYLLSSTIKTDSGQTLDVKKLPPFLRTLLVMDGTVTKSLSAWFWEPVSIQAIQNKVEILNAPIKILGLLQGDKVLHREVSLCGSNSKRIFATARSIVSIRHLPDDIGKLLEEGEIGIGELLQEQGIETYRDIFSINTYPKLDNNKNTDEIICKLSDDIVSRSYKIRVNSVPAIIVTEFFPISLYKNLY